MKKFVLFFSSISLMLFISLISCKANVPNSNEEESYLMYFDYDTTFDLSDFSYPIEITGNDGNSKTIDLVKMGYISVTGSPKDIYNGNVYYYNVPLKYTGPNKIENTDISSTIATINKTKIKVVIAPIGDLDFNGEVDQQDTIVLLKIVLYKDAGQSPADYYFGKNSNENIPDYSDENTPDYILNYKSKFGEKKDNTLVNKYFEKYADVDFDGVIQASDCSVILKFILERDARATEGKTLTLHEYLDELNIVPAP